MIEIPLERRASYLRICRILAVVSTVLAALYLKWLLFDARPENVYLYWLLVAAEAFNIAQAAGFWYTISVQRWSEPPAADPTRTSETVDVFVTVLGEPADIVERTVAAAVAMRHPRMAVHVLDDGRSDEVRDIERGGEIARDPGAELEVGALGARLLDEHAEARPSLPQPVRLWYLAPNFRYDRPQAGRYREHGGGRQRQANRRLWRHVPRTRGGEIDHRASYAAVGIVHRMPSRRPGGTKPFTCRCLR